MKPRWFFAFLVIVITLALTPIAAAQAPLPGGENRIDVLTGEGG